MVKMRSKKAANKRFKFLASGKIKIKHAYTSHLAYSKSGKQKRRLHSRFLLSSSDVSRIRKVIIPLL